MHGARIPFFVLFLSTCLVSAQSDPDFSVVVLPDTQNYAAHNPAIFTAQTQWILQNASPLNIQFVLHEGDIVNGGNEPSQWANADTSMKVLDGRVPYVAAIGNHDYDTNNVALRTAYTKNFNTYFGPSRYAQSPWYRGSYEAGSNENFYSVFTVGSRQFLVLALEVYPRDAVLDWANAVVAANPDAEVIVLTHSYMFSDNTRVGRCDQGGKTDLKVPGDNDGDGMWDKLVRKHANVSLVLSGHIVWNGGIGRRADLGDQGNLVNQVLADFQNYANGGNGYLRILTFHPATNSIEVSTYSPWLDQWLTDARNQFTLKWHADASMAGQPSLVQGRVRSDVDCAFVANAMVIADDANATSDANAMFALSTAWPTSTLNASALGWLPRSMQLAAPAGAGAQAEFFLTPAGKLAGTVIDNSGKLMVGANIHASGGYENTSFTLTTDTNGAFTSDWISAGTYTVSASAEGASNVTTAVLSSGKITAVNLVLSTTPNSYLTGIISSAIDGKPLSGATVSAAGASTITTTSGTYTLTGLPAGTVSVTAAKSGWGSQSSTVALTSGTGSTANIKLATSGRIAGTVKRADGSAASGVKVVFVGGVITNTTSLTTSSTGTFSSTWIPVGNYTVTAGDTAASSTAPATVTAGVTTGILLTLPISTPPTDGTATVAGRVISAIDGKALGGAMITLGLKTATADSTGRYQFSEITTGSYSVCAQKSGWGKQCIGSTLIAGQNALADIKLATSGRISGMVKTGTGTIVTGATVIFSGGVINNTTSVTTNSTGSYISGWVPVGDYSVTIKKTGFVSKTATAKVTAGTTFVLNFTM